MTTDVAEKLSFTNLSEINEAAAGVFEGMKPEKATVAQLELTRLAGLIHLKREMEESGGDDLAQGCDAQIDVLSQWIDTQYPVEAKDGEDMRAVERINRIREVFREGFDCDWRHEYLMLCGLVGEINEAILERGREIEANTGEPLVRRCALINGNAVVSLMTAIQDRVLAQF